MNRIGWALLTLLMPAIAQAELLKPSPTKSVAAIWDSLWPGTYSRISSLTSVMVLATMMAWSGWVMMGLYHACVIKGQISAGDALMLMLRLFTLNTVVVILINL